MFTGRVEGRVHQGPCVFTAGHGSRRLISSRGDDNRRLVSRRVGGSGAALLAGNRLKLSLTVEGDGADNDANGY